MSKKTKGAPRCLLQPLTTSTTVNLAVAMLRFYWRGLCQANLKANSHNLSHCHVFIPFSAWLLATGGFSSRWWCVRRTSVRIRRPELPFSGGWTEILQQRGHFSAKPDNSSRVICVSSCWTWILKHTHPGNKKVVDQENRAVCLCVRDQDKQSSHEGPPASQPVFPSMWKSTLTCWCCHTSVFTFAFFFPLFETWNLFFFLAVCSVILLPVPGADLPACFREFRHLARPIQRREKKKRKKKVGPEMLKRLHNISGFSRLIRPVGKIPRQVNKDMTFSKSPFFSSNFPALCKYSLNIFTLS